MISLCDMTLLKLKLFHVMGAAGFVIKVVVVNTCLLVEIRVTDQDGSVKFLRWQEDKYVDFLGKQLRDFPPNFFFREQYGLRTFHHQQSTAFAAHRCPMLRWLKLV